MERTSEPGTLRGSGGDFPASLLPWGRAGVDGDMALHDKPLEGRGYHLSLNLVRPRRLLGLLRFGGSRCWGLTDGQWGPGRVYPIHPALQAPVPLGKRAGGVVQPLVVTGARGEDRCPPGRPLPACPAV